MPRPRRQLGGIAVALATAVIAVPAYAQNLEQASRDAVVDLCPQLMVIDTPLAEDSRIVARGFVPEGTRQHPRVGTLDIVSKQLDDGKIQIANSRDASFCQIVLEGAGARKAFSLLSKNPEALADNLSPDPAAPPSPAGIATISLRSPSNDGVHFGVQFVDLGSTSPNTPLIIQQYALED